MLRAALYARFSSDLQNPRSASDQLVDCRALAERLGAVVVAEFRDEAISGRSDNRPGRIALMEAAGRRQFDLVIAESINRLSRSGGGTFDAYEDLASLGIRLHTIEQGPVDLTRTAVEALKSALTMEELGHKVRRGHRSVVRDGRKTGGAPYGYRTVIAHDARGERIRGLVEIDPEQAEVVRRIGAAYLAGSTPTAIAHMLNREGVRGPTGRGWTHLAIRGRPGPFGVLANPIYAGEVVYGRVRELKDRRTGKVRKLDVPEAEWTRRAAPELAIFDAETWAHIQATAAERSGRVRRAGNPSAANAPKRLFSGLTRCGVCGAALQTTGPDRRYRCWARMTKGPEACANGRTAPADRFEAEALEALRRDLLHPEVIEAFVLEYHQAQRADAVVRAGARGRLERTLSDARAKADRLVDQIADGLLKGPTVQAKLAKLEAEIAQAEAELAKVDASAEIVTLHPTAAGRYREMVEALQAALAGDTKRPGPELDAARAALRQVVRAVYLHPLEGRGQWEARIDGDLTALLDHAEARSRPVRRFKGA